MAFKLSIGLIINFTIYPIVFFLIYYCWCHKLCYSISVNYSLVLFHSPLFKKLIWLNVGSRSLLICNYTNFMRCLSLLFYCKRFIYMLPYTVYTDRYYALSMYYESVFTVFRKLIKAFDKSARLSKNPFTTLRCFGDFWSSQREVPHVYLKPFHCILLATSP